MCPELVGYVPLSLAAMCPELVEESAEHVQSLSILFPSLASTYHFAPN
jgi:hypothetical protein